MTPDRELILLTGATGYVGGRLLKALEADGRRLRCMARRPEYLRARVRGRHRGGPSRRAGRGWGGVRFGSRRVDSRAAWVARPPEQAYRPISRIGRVGWYYGDPLWRLRGLLDLAIGGPGLRRGRREADTLMWSPGVNRSSPGDVTLGGPSRTCHLDHRFVQIKTIG